MRSGGSCFGMFDGTLYSTPLISIYRANFPTTGGGDEELLEGFENFR